MGKIYLDDFFGLLDENNYKKNSPDVEVNMGKFKSDNSDFYEVFIPGFTKDEIKIDYHDKRIIVSGDKTNEGDDKHYYVSPFNLKCFRKELTVGFEPDEIIANLNEGVLTIRLKRKKKDIPKISFK